MILPFLPPQVSIGLAVFCLPYLRWKHPEWDRPIKVHLFFPIIYVIASIFITIVPMIASPVETGDDITNDWEKSCFLANLPPQVSAL